MRQKLEKCDICEKEFADYKLKQHLMIHNEKKFSCAYCDYKNYSQYYVRKHEKLKHLGIKSSGKLASANTKKSAKIVCSMCNYEGQHNIDLKLHLKVKHNVS